MYKYEVVEVMRSIQEIRYSTGLTQKAFASEFGIPLSTMRKWEQGEASPPSYVLELLSRAIPSESNQMHILYRTKKEVFYYDPIRKIISDAMGNEVQIRENLDGINRQNLLVYIKEYFNALYEIQEKLKQDLILDRIENIVWAKENDYE